MIDVNQQLAHSVSGWRSLVDETPHRLASVLFYDGPPEERASLVNDKIKRLGEKETAIWHFTARENRPIWMVCSYSGTSVLLAKSVPQRIASCSVTYNLAQRISGIPMVEKVVCK